MLRLAAAILLVLAEAVWIIQGYDVAFVPEPFASRSTRSALGRGSNLSADVADGGDHQNNCDRCY